MGLHKKTRAQIGPPNYNRPWSLSRFSPMISPLSLTHNNSWFIDRIVFAGEAQGQPKILTK